MNFARALLWLGLWLVPQSLSAAWPVNTLTPEEQAEGWLLLFDGQSLFGWEPASKANWKVVDDAIAVSEGQRGLLCTTSPSADFHLKVDFRASPRTNSGIFLRTPLAPSDPAGDCYELNIAAPEVSPFFTGSFVGRKKAAEYRGKEDWQTFEVTARGGHFIVLLDGSQVLDYDDPHPLGQGRIGLQFNAGPVEFRNIKLRPLGLAPIFNGKDLRGWKPFSGKPSKFAVTSAGELSITNGPGQLETEGQYANFCLQLDCFVNGANLNSGVFFRNIPGSFAQGYEAQIQNGYRDGDRSRPIDCGTGGIYRRQNARRVMANDRQWFVMTIIAAGDHVATWVNGYPVADWTDARPANENPRQGKRLAAGTITLQGHDPTTNLLFRNLRIAELPGG